MRYQIEFPKTHDIGRLRQLVARRDATLAERLESADVLTPYGVDMRYPEEFEVISQKQGGASSSPSRMGQSGDTHRSQLGI